MCDIILHWSIVWSSTNEQDLITRKVWMLHVVSAHCWTNWTSTHLWIDRTAVSNSSRPKVEEQEVRNRSPSPSIILRRDNSFLNSQKNAWDSSSDAEEEAAERKVPDVQKDDLASRRTHQGSVAPKVHQFVPAPVCSDRDRERWEGIRRASQQTLQEKESRSAQSLCVLLYFCSLTHV